MDHPDGKAWMGAGCCQDVMTASLQPRLKSSWQSWLSAVAVELSGNKGTKIVQKHPRGNNGGWPGRE